MDTFLKSEMNNSKRRLGLDLLRVIAIFAVFTSHSEILLTDSIVPSTLFHYLGFQGVELFFALSGFLIGTGLLQREINDVRGAISFYLRRWLRTLPAFFAALLIFICVHRPSWEAILKVATFSTNLLPESVRSGSAFFHVSWSLAVEEWFYLGLALFVLTFGRSMHSFIGIWIVVLLGRVGFLVLADDTTYDVAHQTVVLRLDAVLVGVLASTAVSSWMSTSLRQRRIARVIYTLTLSLGLATWLGFSWIQYESVLFSTFFLPLNSVALAFLVLDISQTPLWLERVGKSFSRRPQMLIRFIAITSYSLYLYHLDIILLVSQRFANGYLLDFPIALLISVTIAYISFVVVEGPFLRLRTRFRITR